MPLLIKSSFAYIIKVKDIGMNVPFVFLVLIFIQYYQGHAIDEVESFTTILLDDEAYSISSGVKHPKNESRALSAVRTGGFHKSRNHLKTSKGRGHDTVKSFKGVPVLLSKSGVIIHNKAIPQNRHQKQKAVHKLREKSKNFKKNLQKRHFEEHNRFYRKTGISSPKQNRLGPTYRLVLTPETQYVPKDIAESPVGSSQIKRDNFDEEPSSSTLADWENTKHSTAEEPTTDNFEYTTTENFEYTTSENFEHTTTENYEYTTTETSELLEISSTISVDNKRENFPNQIEDNPDFDDTNTVERSYSDGDSSSLDSKAESWMSMPGPTVHTVISRQVEITEVNLPMPLQQPVNEKDEKGSNLRAEDSESDDTVIKFDGRCDVVDNETCWIQREVGDVVTLRVKIDSTKKPSSFQVRWMKVYHIFESTKGKPLEIEPAKLPWNMVSGSEGRELRLNPVTNTDLDPNCFVARVFLLTRHRGKILYTHLKKLVFRIDVPIIDMGRIYAGEELNINIENFISLPEGGNLLFDWKLETKPNHYEFLPSNIKVSSSGRSVILKELKKGRLGVLNCVIYSSNRYAVAKRRFNVLEIAEAENVKRRSTALSPEEDELSHDLLRSRRCRHIIRRSQEKAKQRLEEGIRPKSRKKRFKRIVRRSEIDCEPLRKKAYSRWIRSLFGEITTTDPRLMPLEKLFELSEEGDGTLDDVIPHEVHYVSPTVRILSGTSVERSVGHPFAANCTIHDDCGKDAICVTPEGKTNSTVNIGHNGYCYCRPEFYGDGFTCRKIPPSSHREKRLRRDSRSDFAVPRHLFYERTREIVVTTTEIAEDEEEIITDQPKVLAFEEEESFLLSDCIDDKDCNMHANCIQPVNGHPYCKCRPGFRGSGIFCWETIDYVPLEEHILPDSEINPRQVSIVPEIPLDGLGSKTSEAEEQDEE